MPFPALIVALRRPNSAPAPIAPSEPESARPTPERRTMITHGECGKTWTGLRRSHCPSCHETFNSETAAEAHRRGRFGTDRRCIPPADAGLVPVRHPWGVCWQLPGGDPRFADAEPEMTTAA